MGGLKLTPHYFIIKVRCRSILIPHAEQTASVSALIPFFGGGGFLFEKPPLLPFPPLCFRSSYSGSRLKCLLTLLTSLYTHLSGSGGDYQFLWTAKKKIRATASDAAWDLYPVL